MKTPREASKCREWEKVRRDKLNKSFTTLSKLLPNHDPSLTLSKIEILQKATAYIEELQQKLKDVLTGGGVKNAEREEIKVLYERIRKLLLRNEQLSNLLKDAGIRIPSEYGSIKNFKEPLRWSNKITPEQAKEFAEKEAQKENKKETNKLLKKPKPKNGLKRTTIMAVKHQKKDVKHSTKKLKNNSKKSAVISVQLSNIMPIPTQQKLTKASSQPCFIIASNPSIGLSRNCRTSKSASTVVTNSSSLATPKMASIVTPPASTIVPKVNSTLGSLGPGTLILANGNIVPILPQPATVLPAPTTILTNPTPILLKPPNNNTTLIVMPTKNSKEKNITTSSAKLNTTTENTTISNCSTAKPTKTFARIRPKIGVTKTTQVNKVPIPALTSRYSRLSSSPAKPVLNASLVDKVNQNNEDNSEKKLSKKRKLLKSRNNSKDKRVKVDTIGCTSVSQSESNTSKSNVTNNISEEGRSSQKTVIINDDNKVTNDTLGDGSVLQKCNADVRVPLQDLVNDKTEQPSVESSKKDEHSEGKAENLNVSNISEDSCRNTTEEKLNSGLKNCSSNKIDDKDINDNPEKCNTTELSSESHLSAKPSEPKLIESLLIAEDCQSAHLSELVEKSTEVTETKPNDIKTSDNNCPPPIKLTNDIQTNENNINEMKKISSTTTSEVTTPKTTISVTQSNNTEMQDKNLELGINLNHSELSNDIFSSLQVPIGGQNPESTSPTAAFLLAFPLVSSLTGVKVTEVIEEENSDSRHGTPTLLQIGTMDTTKTTQSMHAESLTPNLLNLDNFSFFSGKEMCNNFYSSFDNSTCSSANVYPVTSVCNANLQVLESQKNSTCRKEDVLNTKPLKVISELQVQPKLQKENASLATTTTNSHVLTSTSSTVPYTSEAQVTTKSNVVAQNNFIRQNTSIAYSKLASVSTSYVHETSMTNSHMHYDGRQKIPSTTGASPCKDINVISYSTASTRKNLDVIQCSGHYTATSNVVSVAQCNTYNPFSDFSKSSTVHSYSTFTKPYGDPLYTNSTHYNYSQPNGNNFEQSVYYSSKCVPSKTGNVAYGSSSYPDSSYNMDCKGKRDSTNQRHNPTNYYNHTKTTKEKFASHSSKVAKPPSNQPKPPINWMTTPDFRSQPTNSEYLVPPPFGKDIEYNPNSFYSSNSFATTTHASYFNASSTIYPTPEFQNPVADNRKSFDSSLPIISSTNSAQRNDFEENQFSWSPTKLPQFLETPHSFVSSTLPTLVGDLALGTTQQPFAEQKVDQGTAREHVVKPKENNRRSKVHPVNYDNQSNFLSVSQLVENKTDLNGSSRATNRRNSSNRNVKSNTSHKGNKHSHKPTETKELVEGANQPFDSKLDAPIEKNSGVKQNHQNVNYNMQGISGNSNWITDCNKGNRHGHKNPQSSYSAEALIGHQDQSDSSVSKHRYRQQQANYSAVNKAIPIPTFLSDNIVPYFPPVEIPQDNNFMQTNPNYQGSSLAHSFPTSVQNNAYTSGTYMSTGATITSSYLQNSGLIPEFGTHDYSATISDNTAVVSDKVVDNKHCTRNEGIKQTSNNNSSRTEERSNLPQQMNTDCSANSSNNFIKKSKHKHSNESNLPGIVDFGFLSMPSTINSPILPDDFHAHSNFLPPPTPSQLYPCKNPLYTKQPSDLNSGSLLSLPPVPVSRSGPQHFDGSAAVGNVSSSLTSFNLSAIFPEINKGPVPLPGLYSEPSRNKSYNFQRNYLGSSVQVSFSNKSTSSSNYVNSVATSYAPSN